MKTIHLLIPLFFMMLVSCNQQSRSEKLQPNYTFDGKITEEVLQNYLSRAVTASEILVCPPIKGDGDYPSRERDIALIKELKAKFIGRSIFRWGREDALENPKFLGQAKEIIDELHASDPDIIFQAAVFEVVSKKTIEKVKIPAWVFEEFQLPIESRCFCYDDMLPADGSVIRKWGQSSAVPDIRRKETQMWFVYLMGSYMNIGVEAFHLGQIHLIGKYDTNWDCYASTLAKVRNYATKHARRHYVLFDAHTTVGMLRNGVSLLDFNSFPMRPVEVEDVPMQAKLEVREDFIYKNSPACVSPSGWKTESLPYLVEFDNYGKTDHPGKIKTDGSCDVWGYDEISWFYLLPKTAKKEFMEYAYHWIAENDPKGHLQMPVARVISLPGRRGIARAIEPSDACPNGMDIVDVIKDLWSE